jgi:hypothetical protein
MFWFDVVPFKAKKWAILMDSQRLPRIYDSKDEAMRAAVCAAQDNYCRHGIASGVRGRDSAGQLRVLAGGTMGPSSGRPAWSQTSAPGTI